MLLLNHASGLRLCGSRLTKRTSLERLRATEPIPDNNTISARAAGTTGRITFRIIPVADRAESHSNRPLAPESGAPKNAGRALWSELGRT